MLIKRLPAPAYDPTRPNLCVALDDR
jgi:hypothetical protein